MEAKGGQVRRLHIIYFLSRMGHIEHPHLIRVHHLCRNGVYLRDVKRWLGELRGKDMPEAFAWSYKRRYKAGYVWQDLLDDDLITPISDNEYVLKGSQTNDTSSETCLLDEKKASILVEEKSPEVHVADDKLQLKPSIKEESEIDRDSDLKTNTPTRFSLEIGQDSMVFETNISTSTLTDEYDLSKVEEDKLLDTGKQNLDKKSHEKYENYSLSSLYHNLRNRKNKKQDSRVDNIEASATPDSSFSTSSSPSQSDFTKSKSYSTGASTVFRNLITCGAVDTDDAALLLVNRGDKKVLKKSDGKTNTKAEICKADKLGEPARSFRTSWDFQQQKYGARKSCEGGKGTNSNKKMLDDFKNQTHFKPLGGPTCSQCGQSFKPEKMHRHMKSCRGMKALANSVATSAKKTQPHRSSTSSYPDSI